MFIGRRQVVGFGAKSNVLILEKNCVLDFYYAICNSNIYIQWRMYPLYNFIYDILMNSIYCNEHDN